MRIISIFSAVCVLCLMGCLEFEEPFPKIPPGIWRGELEIDDDKVIPFNFEMSYGNQDSLIMTLLNGKERIEIKTIQFGKNRKLEDTIRIDFPLMDSHISGEYREDVFEGFWHVHNRDDYHIPFVARFGKSHRFTQLAKEPIIDISGRWATIFDPDDEDNTWPGIGEFAAEDNHVEGTFLTETGDYRYLEGEVQGDRLYLSCFDGAHAFLFEATIHQDSSMEGIFYSGDHYKVDWKAQKDDQATLEDPYAITSATSRDISTVDLALPTTTGDTLSWHDSSLQGKAKIITIMGTWCPNCLDEIRFLQSYFTTHPQDDIVILPIAFERYNNSAQALKVLRRYKQRLGIDWPIMYGGYADKELATEVVGIVDTIKAFPTMIVVDKNDVIQHVHTGFSGPATSEYAKYKEQFHKKMQSLVSE